MSIKYNKKCNGCTACKNICPKKAITMIESYDGFLYPSINNNLCINCGICESICPILKENKKTEDPPITIAAYNKDLSERLLESSGGIFSLLAKETLKNNGVVYGAAMNNNFEKAEHIRITEIDDLYKIYSSKYIQSDLSDVFIKVKSDLENGLLTLFSGTPCQIGGLKCYLKKDYDNLICVDIICHGVPSPKVWKLYKQKLEKESCSKIKFVSFRDKSFGWNNFSFKTEFDNENIFLESAFKNKYIKLFLSNYILRQSCYDCKFKTITRESDITLADLWGANKIVPELNDINGVSFVLLHTKKGNELFSKISTKTIFQKIDITPAIEENSAAIRSVTMPNEREKFFKTLNKSGFDKAYWIYQSTCLSDRIKRMLNKIIKKV